MTSSDPPNAVYRLSRYAHQLPAFYETIVNLHGDEPMLDPGNLDHLLTSYINQNINQNTNQKQAMVLIKKLDLDLAQSKSEAKVVFDVNANMLYCSRSLIPHMTKQPGGHRSQYYGIVGIHVVPKASLLKYCEGVDVTEGWYIEQRIWRS